MATSNVQPIYPSGIFPWTDRVDQQSIDFANDINSTVAEVESIETTVGTTPQIESGVPVGLPVSYPSVSARITDAMTNAQLPYCSLMNILFTTPNTSSGTIVPFKTVLDPYGCYNGSDVTIPASGWWFLSAETTADWRNNGYEYQTLCLNGGSNILDDDLIDWEFSGNVQQVVYSPSGNIVQFNPNTPRWQTYGKRSRRMKCEFHGALHKGDRISVFIENGTTQPVPWFNHIKLKAFMLRTIPSSVSFVSG